MLKGQYKEYQICKNCKKSLPLNREFFKRINYSVNKFHKTCKECNISIRDSKHIKDGLLYCTKCRIYKHKEDFQLSSRNIYRMGTDTRCSSCKIKMNNLCKSNKTLEQKMECLITARYLGARQRAKVKNLEFNITKDYLKKLLINQEYRCAISGIEMSFELFKGRINSNMSLDRIDSKLGYIEGNIQLVCMAVNQMKSDLELSQLLYFCNEIIKHNGN